MAKFDHVLFATDLDHTLLDRNREVSPQTREAIAYFMQNGGRFTLSTGRSLQAFELPRPYLPFNAPVVLSNGAVIYDYERQKLLFERSMSPDSLDVTLEVLAAFPEVGIEAYRVDGVYAFHPNYATTAHFSHVGIERPTWVESLQDIPLPWLKIIYTQSADYLQEVAAWFCARYAQRFDLVFSNPHLLEMQSLEANKGTGVAHLAQLLGIAEKDVYCAGDQQNDCAMVTRFTSFAPENAVDEVKQAATYVVGDCDNHAIRDAIMILDGLY